MKSHHTHIFNNVHVIDPTVHRNLHSCRELYKLYRDLCLLLIMKLVLKQVSYAYTICTN